MSFSANRLAQNLRQVNERIARAAELAGRDPTEIQLVAVTKYVSAEVIQGLYDLGCFHFGENRPQVLWQKAEQLDSLQDPAIQWHQIGHLQTNKVRRTLPLVSLLHAGDSVKLLECVNDEAARLDSVQQVLCEVNISGDETKHGFNPDQLKEALEPILAFKNIKVCGLMAMASLKGGVDQAQEDFNKMTKLKNELEQQYPDPEAFKELSMGMSGDFEQAIAHGATLVRVGSLLYEGIE